MRDSSHRTPQPILPLWQRFRQMHDGPHNPTLLREFERTRQEILRLREAHASWIRLTRMT